MSYQKIDKNILNRKSDTLINNLSRDEFDHTTLFILSSDDHGVVFNGGRKGARLAPKVLLKEILKLPKYKVSQKIKYFESCTFNSIQNKEEFAKFQMKQIEVMASEISTDNNIIHFGGGHDHIYTFVKSLISKRIVDENKITILNFDAHLDTRSDDINHSGTPFRQLYNEHSNIEIIQLGIHEYANVQSSFDNIKMKVHTCDEIKNKTDNFDFKKSQKFIDDIIKNIPKDHHIIISVDLDGFRASDIRAVSAVNHSGLPLHMLEHTIEVIKGQEKKVFLGIYEYNPLFDTLACEDARKIAAIIYEKILMPY